MYHEKEIRALYLLEMREAPSGPLPNSHPTLDTYDAIPEWHRAKIARRRKAALDLPRDVRAVQV